MVDIYLLDLFIYYMELNIVSVNYNIFIRELLVSIKWSILIK